MGLFDFFKKDKDKDNTAAIEMPCPNCWGYQEWSDGVKDVLKDHQRDVNNHTTKDAFVKNIQVTYVDGIQLKKDGNNSPVFYCKSCNKNYTVSEGS